MKNKSYLWAIIVGAVVGIIMNIEATVLQGHLTIEEQYMSSVFPFNLFLEHKQYFVSFKIMLAALIYLCLTVNIMKKKQMPYVLLRVKKRYCWEYRATYEIVKVASLFYLGITLIIFFMSVFISKGKVTFSAWKVWYLSWISLIYLGVILGCFVNMVASFLNVQTAVIITYILFLLGTYGTMQCSEFFARSKILMYVNPITAISIVEEKQVVDIVFAVLGMCIVGCICQCLLALVYMRWEKRVRSEN